jgi:hypothetical protein
MTTVQKIHRALQSGRLKSELRTVSEAIHAARALTMQIEAAGLKHDEDFQVHIAYLTPDLSMLFTERYIRGEESAIHAKLAGPGTCCIMAGLVFGIRDKEHGGDFLIGARPFLETPLVLSALRQRMEENTMGVS